MILLVIFSWTGFIVIFSTLIILSLLTFKWLSNRKVKKQILNGENSIVVLNSIVLIISMLGLVISVVSRYIMNLIFF